MVEWRKKKENNINYYLKWFGYLMIGYLFSRFDSFGYLINGKYKKNLTNFGGCVTYFYFSDCGYFDVCMNVL